MNTALAKAIGKAVKLNAPKILAALGVTGIFATALSASHATAKACEAIKEEEHRREFEQEVNGEAASELTKKEKFKLVWKYYIPTVTTILAASSSIIAANCIMYKRNAALAASASLAINAYKDYKESVEKVGGEELVQKVQNDISQKKLDQADFSNIVDTGNGKELCYEPYSGRLFLSSIEQLRHAENNLAFKMLDDMWVTLNDYYYELGLEQVHHKLGDRLGWHLQDGRMSFSFDSRITQDGRPCIVVNTHLTPEYEYMFR